MPAITVTDVYKSFRIYADRSRTLKDCILSPHRSRFALHPVLCGVSLTVETGETVGLIGRNGCGKSTLLKIISRILYPDSGTAAVSGRVSSLLELGAGFHPDLTGRENVYANAAVFGLSRRETGKRLPDIIDFSGLADCIDRPVRTYSSGMYMRLAFSVAMHVQADILLLDEILAVGDAAFQAKCTARLRAMRASGVTAVIVSHSTEQLRTLCSRIVWLENGTVRADGSPEEILPAYLAACGQ